MTHADQKLKIKILTLWKEVKNIQECFMNDLLNEHIIKINYWSNVTKLNKIKKFSQLILFTWTPISAQSYSSFNCYLLDWEKILWIDCDIRAIFKIRFKSFHRKNGIKIL